MQQVIRCCRINLEGMPKTHLLGRYAGNLSETFVDELGSDDCMLSFERVSSRQIIVFTCIDNNTGSRVDTARKELIDQRALHVYIAENNTVEGVIKHHIKSL